MKKEEFINKCKEKGLLLDIDKLNKLDEYASFLVEYNQKINLTSILDYEEILDKHFYDSLLLSFYKDMHGTLVDIGTGAGFPGVVLKICYEDLKVILVEPIKKRCIFLNELINKLELKNIEVINDRGENYSLKHREEYDFVTARAVTNLPNLIEVSGALVKTNGYFIALRGNIGNEEISDAKKAIKVMGFEIESINEDYLFDGSKRIISFMKKVKESPIKYPRQYSIIKQNPL